MFAAVYDAAAWMTTVSDDPDHSQLVAVVVVVAKAKDSEKIVSLISTQKHVPHSVKKKRLSTAA